MNFRPACLLPLLLCGLFVCAPAAATDDDEPPKLLGRCATAQLEAEPFAEWHRPEYDEYTPDAQVLRALRGLDFSDFEMTIFFGTWCGDSRREVPRMLKLLDTAGVPAERVHLIAVDGGGDSHKQSPAGEERGLEIYRVPTFVIGRGGNEVARIVEYPVLSLERDLLAILAGEAYEPNYPSYPVIREWLTAGLLGDPNVSARGLAGRVRGRVASEGELGAAATVLLARGQPGEAIKLMEANCALYRESSRCQVRLAEALVEAGRPEAARRPAERAIRLNEDSSRTEALLELLESTLE